MWHVQQLGVDFIFAAVFTWKRFVYINYIQWMSYNFYCMPEIKAKVGGCRTHIHRGETTGAIRDDHEDLRFPASGETGHRTCMRFVSHVYISVVTKRPTPKSGQHLSPPQWTVQCLTCLSPLWTMEASSTGGHSQICVLNFTPRMANSG